MGQKQPYRIGVLYICQLPFTFPPSLRAPIHLKLPRRDKCIMNLTEGGRSVALGLGDWQSCIHNIVILLAWEDLVDKVEAELVTMLSRLSRQEGVDLW